MEMGNCRMRVCYGRGRAAFEMGFGETVLCCMSFFFFQSKIVLPHHGVYMYCSNVVMYKILLAL